MGTLLGGGFGKRPKLQEGKPRRSNIPSFSTYSVFGFENGFWMYMDEKDWFLFGIA